MNPQPARAQSADAVYAVLRRVAARRQPAAATYDGLPRLLCPGRCGRKSGRLHALVDQFEGVNHSGPATKAEGPGGWRCLIVEKFSQVELQVGAWHTAPRPSRQTCADEVDFDADAQPGGDPQ
jgi:hypothetical protein